MSTDLAEKVTAARDTQRGGSPPTKTATVAERIQAQRDEIARALPRHIDPDRFTRVVLTQIRKTPKLSACEWPSLAAAVMQLAQVGLEPDGRNAHLVPYGRECTPIIDYRGYMELARRSGQVADIYAEVVRDHDVFRQTLGLHRDLVHEPADGDRGDIVAVYAVVRFVNGGFSFVVLDRTQIDARRGRSKTATASHSPWKTDEEAMVLKTAIRALAKYLPYSPEIANAEDIDRRDDHTRNVDDLGDVIDIDAIDDTDTDSQGDEAA